ncbi:MAG: transporter [Methylovirgula sp.]
MSSIATSALAIGTEPYDNTPQPDGSNLLIFYYDFGTSSTLNLSGTAPATGANHLDANIGLLRYIRFFKIAGHTALVQVVQPFGILNDIQLSGQPISNAGGAGDTIISAAAWLYEDGATRRFVSLTDYLSVPDGSYDPHAAFNLGGNRYTNDMQLAVTYGLFGRFTLDVNLDFIAYGDNNNVQAYGPLLALQQKPTEQAAFWLDYAFDDGPYPGSFAAIGFFSQYGGRQTLDGVPNGLMTEEYRVRATYATFIAPSVQLLLQVNHDIKTVGGFNQDFGLEFRLTKAF